MKFVAFYSVNVEIQANSIEEAKEVAKDFRHSIGIDFGSHNKPKGIRLEVRDETLIVNTEKVIEWPDY